MGVDTSIYNHLLRPVKSVAEYDAEAMANQQNRLAVQASRMQLADRERGVQQENALAGVYRSAVGADGKTDRTKLFSGAAQAGLGAKLPGMQEAYAKQDKAEREAEKEQFALGKQRLELIHNAIAGSKDQGSYTRNRQMLAQNGIDISQIPEQYDPAFVEDAGVQSLTHLERVKQVMEEKGFALKEQEFGEKVRSNKADEGHKAGQLSVSRGNLAVSQANFGLSKQRLAMDRADAGPSGPSGARGKAPAGYRWTANGDQEPIPGGPAGNKSVTTEGERKAATLLSRLQGSEKQLEAALKDNPNAAKPGLIAQGLRNVGAEAVANTVAVGPERQRVESAQLDILDAALTLGTGAAYTREQLEGYRKSYFPQIGDTPGNVKDKKARLKNVIEAAKIAAGRAAPTESTQAKPGIAQKKPANNIDALLDKYKD